MNTKRLVKGEIFFDNFNEIFLDEHWEMLPNDPLRFSLIERPGHLKLYHGPQDIYVLTAEPESYVLDMRNEYVPLNTLVQSGLVVFRELDSNLEILEFYDVDRPEWSVYEYLRLIKKGNNYTIYARQAIEYDWELIDTVIFESSGKVGLLCRGPEVPGASIFSVDFVKIYRSQEIQVLNVPVGYRVELRREENHAVIVSRKVTSPYNGVELTVKDIPNIRAYFTILNTDNITIHTSSVFEVCGGDVYYYGTTLDVYVNGLDMKPDAEYFLGYYEGNEILFTVTLHNPNDEEFNEVTLSAIQYADDLIGYTLVRFSSDNVTFDTTVSIGTVLPDQEVTIYGKVIRDPELIISDVNPLKFSLNITNS